MPGGVRTTAPGGREDAAARHCRRPAALDGGSVFLAGHDPLAHGAGCLPRIGELCRPRSVFCAQFLGAKGTGFCLFVFLVSLSMVNSLGRGSATYGRRGGSVTPRACGRRRADGDAPLLRPAVCGFFHGVPPAGRSSALGRLHDWISGARLSNAHLGLPILVDGCGPLGSTLLLNETCRKQEPWTP